MTVLVVDDEPAFRALVRDILMADGFDVLTAENGEEALRKLSVVHPDVIVADIYMPVMDGIKLHRLVRDNPRYATLPFIFVSGYSDEYAQTSMRDPRYDGFIRKGRPPQEIKEWIKYLTTPEDRRAKFFPGQSSRLT